MSGFDLQKLLRDVFEPKPGEKVLVLTDRPSAEDRDTPEWSARRAMAEEWRKGFEQLELEVHPLLEYKATGSHNADLPEKGEMGGEDVSILDLLSQVDIAMALTEFSATAPLSAAVKATHHLRVASMPGVARRMEESALAADYKEVARKANILADMLTRAESSKVKFSTGHELFFDLRYRKATADDGRATPDKEWPLVNLPSGEAFIVPYEGERKGEPSLTWGEIPVMYGCQMVTLKIEANRITHIDGEGRLAESMRAYFKIDPARGNVAELGLGCNDRAIITGNVLEDEKAGMHWAYGRSEHLGGTVGPDAFEKPEYVVHRDVVYAHDSPITVEFLSLQYPDDKEEEIMRDGEYTIF